MAKLSTAARNKLPDSAFAGPNRSYPVNDTSHAKNAKSRVSQFGSPALKAKVDAKADKKLKIGDGASGRTAKYTGKSKPYPKKKG